MIKINRQIATIILAAATVIAIIAFGSIAETQFLKISENISQIPTVSRIAGFFAVINLNVLLLFLMVFLTFRNGVKLAIDRANGRFGSTLRTRLVTAFLFFSLLPTIVLIYISTKFVNANFDLWIPKNIIETTNSSLLSEKSYQAKILTLLESGETKNFNGYDFAYNIANKKVVKNISTLNEADIISAIENLGSQFTAKWVGINETTMIALAPVGKHTIAGIVSPKNIHQQWQLLSKDFSTVQSGLEIFRFSYYAILVVLTLLIVFSATWLGFTVAREFTIPIQRLAAASASIASGEYTVQLDDIVTDDEIGTLALSFRSMVNELHASKIKADASAHLLNNKASELLEKSEYTSVLLRDINAAVITLDEDLTVESWNLFATRIFGISEELALGKKISTLLDADFTQKLVAPALAELIQTENNRLSTDYTGMFGNTEKQINVTLSKVSNPQRKTKLVLFINDMTEITRIQRLAAWRDVARRIAHEIKNPLTPIRLGTQRLQRRLGNKLTEDDNIVFQESTTVILRCVESITGLVDEFVRFSRMPTPVLKPGSLLRTVQIAVSSFQDNLDCVPVVLQCDQQYLKADHMCHFDADQMLRLCVNLISNAVAATKATVHTQQTDLLAPAVIVRLISNGGCAEIQICDQGLGIPTSMKSRIFEPYFSTKGTGTGLGLVIVQQIAKDHGANVRLESNSPKGSIFSVTMPPHLESKS